MARGTLGTGMMAPLSMADNFHGDYYAGPSGAAIGALMASQAIGDGFRDWGAAKRDNMHLAEQRQLQERAQLQAMNNKQAVAQAINPMRAAESSGMGNRDVSRRSMLPDASTQMALAKMQEEKAQQEKGARDKQFQSLASLWYANGGEQADPGGAKFQERFGVSPYEYVPQGVITSMANLDLRRDLADESQQTRVALAQMAAAGRGGGGGGMGAQPTEPQPQYLPLDAAARKNLAEWVSTASDASRVANTLDAAMGARIDPATGQKVYNEQPSGMFEGGTGLILGNLPDKVASRLDPDGVTVRSSLANFSSQIMNALSGAAVSEQEKKRLESFLPTSSDSWVTLRQKMAGYQDYLREKGTAWQASYGDHDVLNRGLSMLGGGQAAVQQPASTPTNSGRWPVNRSTMSGDPASDADALIKKYGGGK